MANNAPALDTAFYALADPTRRAVVARLGRGGASVSELAAPFAIGLPTFLKHLKVLEQSGLVETGKHGRTRICRLRPARLTEVETWLAEQRQVWEARTDRLAAYVETHLKDADDAE